MKFFSHIKKSKRPTHKQVLRERFKNFVLELKVRGFSEKTIDAYLYYNGRFLDFIGKEPRSVSSVDVKSYLNYLVGYDAGPRTVNMAISSLKAYYESFMHKRLFAFIKRPKAPKDLPRVLSKDEIMSMIGNAGSLKHKLLIELLYSSGMRVGECVKIKVEDIQDKIVFIKKGKGKKDRFTITSGRFIDDLRAYLDKRKKPSIYLFDNGSGSHIGIRTAEEIVKQAAKRAGIRKRAYPHLLRASFATHLLENKVNIDDIQKLLGHSSRETTKGYIRAKTDGLMKIKSPLD